MATIVPQSSQEPVSQPPQLQVHYPGAFNNASLYVGDLDTSVTESQLINLFNQVSPIASVKICIDQQRMVSLGYGYVNYNTRQDALKALEVLNFTPLNGKPIRIMLSQRDPSIRKSGRANVFIKNLETSIDSKALHDTFASFGSILSCKVAMENNGQSKGYGFVQFEQDEAAQKAISTLNGMLMNDKQVYVGLFVRRQERYKANESPKFTNVYVKNLSETTSDEDLKILFGNYGSITSAVVMRDASGNSRGFGFVNFLNPEDAVSAVEKLNGTSLDEKILYVGKAQRKSEREDELKAKFEHERIVRFEKLQGANLYLKHLDDSVDDEKLMELFSEFGTVTSCKVLLDPQGASRGFGFVAFSTPEEAGRALKEMNRKMVGQKPLYVAVAQRKDERKARLEAQFAQIRTPGVMALVLSSMPGFHFGGPSPSPQQMYFGQDAPGLVHPQPTGYGFQQQLIPGIHLGVAPNFIQALYSI